ncbi:hypothetical protein F5Y13DRAFT_172518 [Hypoxylon sp. FL1857]|nr:hypothetical protein F5Y13DRAFT_172518 [Hypoxylon sp. FL1857]
MGPPEPVFHLFPLLPFELRREIYILATPPRIVHVRESWDFEDHDDFMQFYHESGSSYDDSKQAYAFEKFQERYRNETLKVKLHPDLAYFARNWRHRIPFGTREYTQMTLESYGFTSQPAPYQPWLPTNDTPEIPLAWLENHLDIAFKLVRQSYLYSRAPIPPLLHVCAESREVLTDYGYRMAFSTRTWGPRTWFHFGRDRLYVSEYRRPYEWNNSNHGYCDLLTGTYWDILGQFNPKDLQQVKSLVLGRSNDFMIIEVENILRLLPKVEELFLEGWDQNCLHGWFYATDKEYRSDCERDNDSHGTKELWRCVPVEEIDVVAQIFCLNTNNIDGDHELPRSLTTPILSLYDFNQYKEDGIKYISFFESEARRFETAFEIQKDDFYARRKPPKIKFVHTCSESMARRFIHGRLMFWHFYTEFKKAYAKDKPCIPLTVDSPALPPPFRVYWSNDLDERDWDSFNMVQEIDASLLWDFGNPSGNSNMQLRGWYLARVNPLKPSLEII